MNNAQIHDPTPTSGKTISLARRAAAGFSLIEIMIVVIILGALVGIIIPQFNQSESEAKDVGCDASNYGTLRQISNSRSINGVYPSRLHTGFEADAATGAPMGTSDCSKLAPVTATNLVYKSTWVALTADQAASLKAAGIVNIAYGGFGIDAGFVETASGVHVASVTSTWLEDHDDTTTEVTINGADLTDYRYDDPYTSTTVDGIVVPLIAAPTSDFENDYHGSTDSKYPSKISIAQVGACPWVEKGTEFPFYVCFFKVFNDGTPAKMIGTACPECGSLNP